MLSYHIKCNVWHSCKKALFKNIAECATTSPCEAIKLAEEHSSQISILITDVVMPEMNGKLLANTLQKSMLHLKCIFMSGYTANVIAHQGLLDEDVFFITKPFTADDLIAKVGEVLSKET